MKKSNLLTTAAAVMLLTAAPAAAQTCIKTPSCADLGYTKTAANCAGQAILKCPLDNTQVYCPGTTAINTPKTYRVGDIAPGGGTVVAVNSSGTEGTRVVAAGVGAYAELRSYCASLSGSGTIWQVASSVTLEKMNKSTLFFSSCAYYYHSGSGYCHLCGNNIGDCSYTGSQSTAGGYCEAPF